MSATRRTALAPLLFAALPLAVAVACYGPTQVTVEVLTDLDCATEIPRAALVIGGAPIGETADGDCRVGGAGTTTLGDLVLTPGGRSGRSATVSVTVRVSTRGGDPKDCAPGKPSCVVTTRRFTYREHEQRRVPIRVYRACVAKDCGDGACVADGAGQAACVADNECKTDECVLAGEAPLSPSPPPPVPDAGADGAVDAGPPPACSGPVGDGVVASGVAGPKWTTVVGGRVYWLSAGSLSFYEEATRTVQVGTPPGAGAAVFEALAPSSGSLWAVKVLANQRTVVANLSTASEMELEASAMNDAQGFVVVQPDETSGFASDGAAVYQASTTVKQVSTYFSVGAVALGYTGTGLLLLHADGTLDEVPFADPSKATPLASDVNALASDVAGTFVSWGPGGSPVRQVAELKNATLSPLSSPILGADVLALDATHVYALSQGVITRRSRDASVEDLVMYTIGPPPNEPIATVAVDPSASGCVYYWTAPTGKGVLSTLRVSAK